MAAQRFRCMERECDRYARVSIEDAEGQRVRACPRHAVAAIDGLAGARVVWDDTRAINEYEVTALRLAEERSQLSREVWLHEHPSGPRVFIWQAGWAGSRAAGHCQEGVDSQTDVRSGRESGVCRLRPGAS